MTRIRAHLTAALLALVAPGVVTACGRAEADEIRVPLDSLACDDLADGRWESAPLPTIDGTCRCGGEACGWIPFHGRDTVEVEHPLGRTPALVVPYVAFDEDGYENGSGGTLASGDVALILGVSDTVVTLKNNTNERFVLRLVLE